MSYSSGLKYQKDEYPFSMPQTVNPPNPLKNVQTSPEIVSPTNPPQRKQNPVLRQRPMTTLPRKNLPRARPPSRLNLPQANPDIQSFETSQSFISTLPRIPQLDYGQTYEPLPQSLSTSGPLPQISLVDIPPQEIEETEEIDLDYYPEEHPEYFDPLPTPEELARTTSSQLGLARPPFNIPPRRLSSLPVQTPIRTPRKYNFVLPPRLV